MDGAHEAVQAAIKVGELSGQIQDGTKVVRIAEKTTVAALACISLGLIITGAVASIADLLFNLAYENSQKISPFFYNLFK